MIKQILKSKKARTAIKVLTSLLTLGIIAMLVLSGPATAFSLSVNSDKQSILIGDKVTFDVNLNVNNDEFNDINSLTLVIDGPSKKECTFDISGNKLSPCSGVEKITSSITDIQGYGYLSSFGYGYSAGKQIKFLITINSQGYLTGDYSTSIKVVSESSIITEAGNNLKIVGKTGSTTYSSSSSHNTETSESTETGTKGRFNVNGGEDFTVMTDGMWHEMKIVDVSSEYIKLKFDDQFYDLKLGEIKEFTLDNDEKIEVNVWFIGNGEATIYVDAQNSKLVEKKTVIDIPQQYITENENMQTTVYNNDTQNVDNKIGLFDILGRTETIIALIFFNLIVIELIMIANVKRNSKRRVRKSLRRY
jgi:hypothetical protein